MFWSNGRAAVKAGTPGRVAEHMLLDKVWWQWARFHLVKTGPKFFTNFPLDFYQVVTDMRGGNIIKFDIVKKTCFCNLMVICYCRLPPKSLFFLNILKTSACIIDLINFLIVVCPG